MTFCVIRYYLHNFKNVKVTRFTKSNTPHGRFSRFLNAFLMFLTPFFCTNGTKSREASHMYLKKPCSFTYV